MATAVSSQTLDNQLAALQNEVEHTVQVAGLNGVEATNGSSVPGLGHSKFIAGMIYPPPDIRTIIDRTASFVARSANPPQFEDKIRESRREDPKFSFLNSADPYHAYYRHRIQKIEGGDEDVVMDSKPKDDLIAKPVGPPKEVVPKEPPPQEFVMEIPHIGAADLDTMKLTALFTARRGRSFLASLSTREGRNYEFDFLRPTHSLFAYFNRLVEQYTRVLLPSKETLQSISEMKSEEGRWRLLEDARERGEWERWKREKERKKEDDKEAEAIAFAEIDWHDYAIVQTIEFTAADAQSELPPPMSIAEVENMTLAQKRMAAMIMENTAPEVEAIRASQLAAEEAAAILQAQQAEEDGDVEMEVDSEDEEMKETKRKEMEEKQRELERAKELQAKSLEHGAPLKIRKDYIPKTLAAKNAAKATMTTCTICGQQVPVDELEEHMRIELLDPRWKSQRDAIEARRAQANELQRGANVVTSLKHLARTRVDLFDADEARRKAEEEEENAKRKEREKVVWDGHTASKENTLNKFQSNVNFDEQIRAIHKAKGLGQADTSTIGPGIGPSIGPSTLPPPPINLPHNASSSTDPTYAAATISAGPQPASMYPTPMQQTFPPGMPAFGQPGGPPGAFTFGVPGGMHPSRIAALASANAAIPGSGAVRGADDQPEDAPPAKRQKIERLPHGHLYPEQDWINLHPYPISLSIQLPTLADKPEWKLDGTVAAIPDLPLTLLVSTLRDRILQHLESTVPASQIRISFGPKVLTNANTLASYNLEDEDFVYMTVKDKRKK